LLRAHLPHWEELIHLVERARRIVSLDFDLEEPRRHLARDPVIGPLLRARPGLRAPGTWDPFETGVRAIIGQQISVAAANTITGRLVDRLGIPVPGLERLGLTHTFPSAEAFTSADLTGLGLTRGRTDAIRSFAGAVAEDAVRLDRSVSLERLIASLTSIEGVGPWTAHYLGLRLGEPDACPIRADEVDEHWRPWRALATAHLWMADGSQQAQAAA
jgi:AraC family transcriptional regulator, regulatory protein of adaptative response / DNA-3-methyladenine glycosylase II